jgi:hypothetical protein
MGRRSPACHEQAFGASSGGPGVQELQEFEKFKTFPSRRDTRTEPRVSTPGTVPKGAALKGAEGFREFRSPEVWKFRMPRDVRLEARNLKRET